MDLTRYVDRIRRELAVVAAAGGEEAEALADRLTAPLESTVRLMLLDALSSATAEITRDMAPGSVHVRLRGQDPDFVVNTAPSEEPGTAPEAPPVAPLAPSAASSVPPDGGMSRINLRLPDELKARVEEAAERERLSVNAWLVRAAARALDQGQSLPPRMPGVGQSYSGWVH